MSDSGAFRAEEIWDLAVSILKNRSESLYNQWFSQMTAVDVKEDLLTIGVPDDFFLDVVADNYGDLLQSALDNINGKSYRFELRSGVAPRPVFTPAQPAPARLETSVPRNNRLY